MTDDAIAEIMARAIDRYILRKWPEHEIDHAMDIVEWASPSGKGSVAAALSALRSAGYLIIPPLDTPEGEAAVERGAEDIWQAECSRAVSRPRSEPWIDVRSDVQGPYRHLARVALRAAGATDD